MSFHAVGWAARLRGLQPHQKLVLLMLAERSDVDTNMTWPSYALIAADTGLSRRTCIAVCSQLEALGLITASARAVQGRQTSNQYEVHVGSNPKGAPAAPHGAPAAPPGGAPAAPPGGAPAAPEPIREEPVIEPGAPAEPSLFKADLPKKERPPTSGETRARGDDAFDRFWTAYPAGPRKTDKPKARALFTAIVAGRHKGIAKTDAEAIIAGVEAWASSKRDPAFDPMPTTWLNGARWEQHATEAKIDHRPKVIEMLTTYYREMAKISGKATISGEGRRALDMAKTFIDVERWSRPEIEEMKTEAQRRAAGSPSSHSGTSR